MKQILLLITILISLTVKAQFNVIQDGEGETSFQLFQSNTITLNTEKTSLGFSITPKKIVNKKNEKYWTITASANAKKGSSNLFKGGEFQFSGKLGGNLIFDKTDYGNRVNPGDGNLKYYFLGVELLYSRNNVFDSSREFDKQIFNKTNIGIRINYGWNFQNIIIDNKWLKFFGELTVGISGSIGIKDNTDILTQKEVVTSTETITNGTIMRTLSSSSDVYEADKLILNQKFSRLNFDLGKYFFKQRFFANTHLTYSIDEQLKPVLNPSFGVFVTQKGAPLEAILGIQVQTSDWFNTRFSKKSRWERSSIVLTAGFPFN